MGKKTSSGKDRKMKRKEEAAKALETQKLIKKLNEETDLLATLPAFRSFSRNGLDAAVLSCSRHSSLPRAVADELFALCKRNMQRAYDAAWGWSDAAKRAELSHGAARFLLVVEKGAADVVDVDGKGAAAAAATDTANNKKNTEQQQQQLPSDDDDDDKSDKKALPSPAPSLLDPDLDPSKVLAYAHYRFEADEATGEPILYVYEVQLREGAATRRRGLGRFLMQLLELAARQRGLAAVTLTVQDSNAAAAALYASLGYSRDPGSPCPLEEPEAGYTILTKLLPAPRQPLLPSAIASGVGGNGEEATTSAAKGEASSSSVGGKGALAAAASALAAATLASKQVPPPAAAAVAGQR